MQRNKLTHIDRDTYSFKQFFYYLTSDENCILRAVNVIVGYLLLETSQKLFHYDDDILLF